MCSELVRASRGDGDRTGTPPSQLATYDRERRTDFLVSTSRLHFDRSSGFVSLSSFGVSLATYKCACLLETAYIRCS